MLVLLVRNTQIRFPERKAELKELFKDEPEKRLA